MIKYIIRKVIYSLLVLWGAITVVFLLFNADPSDAMRANSGKAPTEEQLEEMKKVHKLDVPLFQQYILYLNDLSPISFHNKNVKESRVYLDEDNYSYSELFSVSENRTMVIKYPYLRRSYANNERVIDKINDPIKETAILAFYAILIAVIIGIPFGIFSALYRGTFIDGSSLVISTLGMSAPSFVTALLIQWIFSVVWFEETNIPILPFVGLAVGLLVGIIWNKSQAKKRFTKFSYVFLGESAFKGAVVGSIIWLVGFILTGFGMHLPLVDSFIITGGTDLPTWGTLHDSDDMGDPYLNYPAVILPAITLGIRPLAVIVQLTRSSMLSVMSQDYIRTAKAKGLAKGIIIHKHALKNALNPVITSLSGSFASMLTGAIFVEYVFDWKGIGSIMFDAITITKDMPTIMGIVLFISVFFVIINIVVDVIYGILDPRVRVK